MLSIVKEKRSVMIINKSIENAWDHTIGYFEEMHSIIVKSTVKEKRTAVLIHREIEQQLKC